MHTTTIIHSSACLQDKDPGSSKEKKEKKADSSKDGSSKEKKEKKVCAVTQPGWWAKGATAHVQTLSAEYTPDKEGGRPGCRPPLSLL